MLDMAGKEEQAARVLEAPAPEAPPPPPWAEMDGEGNLILEPQEPKRVPVYMFSRAILIHGLSGVYGMGYGRVQGDFNKAANTILSQYVDTAGLNNAPAWLASNQVTFDNGLDLSPGAINKTNLTGDELSNQMIPIQVPRANPQMLNLVESVVSMSKSAVAAPDILSGAQGPSGETFRGQSQRLEEANSQLSEVTSRLGVCLKNVLMNNNKMNAEFLHDDEMLALMDHKIGQMRQVVVGRDLYQRGFQVSLTADMRFVSQQIRTQEATELMQLPAQIPMLQNNVAFAQYAAMKYLQARDMADAIPFLGPPLPPPETPMGLPPPEPPPGMENDEETVDAPPPSE